MIPVTSPVSVGQVSVEVVASAKALAKSLKREVEAAFKDLDVSKAIQDAVGRTPIKVKVSPEVDTTGLGEKIRKTRIPKIPVEADLDTDPLKEKIRSTRVPKVPVTIDPVMAAFQAEVRRQTTALAKQTLTIPVDGDTAGLRAGVSAQLAAIQTQAKITVPTEPGDKATYEAKLRTQLAEVSRRVKVHVDTKVDVSAFAALRNAASSAGGSLSGLLGSLSSIGGVLAGVGASAFQFAQIGIAAVAAIPGVTALAGAIAALPGLVSGVGAGIATLLLGFKGVSDAFKPKTGAAGGKGGGEDPAARARRVAAAERGVEAARRGIAAASRGLESAERGLVNAETGVAEAQQRARAAQVAVSQARKDAAEDIADLGRALRGAKLDEADAALAVTNALRDLNAAREKGNLPDIQAAELAYQRAVLDVDNTRDATKDLQREQAKTAKSGVDGSDKVKAALQDQRDAVQGVRDAQDGLRDAQDGVLSANDSLKASYDSLKGAQDSLADAQKKTATAGGGGGALATLVKLAPNARRFVAAVKALKPAFEALRLDVQNRLFKDLDDTVTSLARAWLPALKRQLGGFADDFNEFFRNLGASLGKPKFVTDIEVAISGVREAFRTIGRAVTTSLVPAFGALAAASKPFIEALGARLAAVVTQFSRWVLAGERSGGLQKFFANATQNMREIFDIGGSVVKIIGSLIETITGQRISSKKSPLDALRDSLDRLSQWLDKPQNQQQIRDFLASVETSLITVGRIAKNVAGFINAVLAPFRALSRATKSAKEPKNPKTGKPAKQGALAKTINVFAGYTPDGSRDLGKAVWDGIVKGFKDAARSTGDFFAGLLWRGPNSLIGRIKSGLGIASPSKLTVEIGAELVNGLIKGVGDRFGALVDRVKQIPGRILAGLGNLGSLLVSRGRDVISGLINGIGSRFGAAQQAVGQLRARLSAAAGSMIGLLYNRGRDVISGLISGIGSRLSSLAGAVSNAAGWTRYGLRNAGSILFNAGRSILEGLKQGIASKLSSLGSFLGKIGGFIADHKGPIEKDRKLLIPQGRAIMEGLIGGIASKRDALAGQLSDVTSQIGTDATATLNASVSGGLDVPDLGRIVVEWGPTSDPVLNGIRQSIKFKYNGNPVAALAS